jgi:hypothetical protein
MLEWSLTSSKLNVFSYYQAKAVHHIENQAMDLID